jgi:hypothetical protein
VARKPRLTPLCSALSRARVRERETQRQHGMMAMPFMDGATDKSTVWFFLAFLLGSSHVLQPPLYIRPHLPPASSSSSSNSSCTHTSRARAQPKTTRPRNSGRLLPSRVYRERERETNEHLGERAVRRSAGVPVPPDGGGAAQLLPPQEGRLPGDRPRRHPRRRPQQARAMGHPRYLNYLAYSIFVTLMAGFGFVAL